MERRRDDLMCYVRVTAGVAEVFMYFLNNYSETENDLKINFYDNVKSGLLTQDINRAKKWFTVKYSQGCQISIDDNISFQKDRFISAFDWAIKLIMETK